MRSAPYLHDPTRYFAQLANGAGGWSGMGAAPGDDLRYFVTRISWHRRVDQEVALIPVLYNSLV